MLTLDVSIRNAQAEAVRTAAANGSLLIKSGAGNTLCTIALGSSPFAAAANGGIALNGTLSGVAGLGGTATYFELRRSDASLILQGTVSSIAADLILSTTTIQVNDTITVSSLAYYVPAA